MLLDVDRFDIERQFLRYWMLACSILNIRLFNIEVASLLLKQSLLMRKPQ